MSDLSYEEIHDALFEARERITDPRRWVKGSYLAHVEIDLQRVPCFCAAGAIYEGRPMYSDIFSVYTRVDVARQAQVLEFFYDHAGVDFGSVGGAVRGDHEEQITLWNDSAERTHAEVLAAFDRAIVVALGLLLDEWVATWESLRAGSDDRGMFWDGNLCYVCARGVRHPSHCPAGRPWQCPLGLRAEQADDIRRWRGEVRP